MTMIDSLTNEMGSRFGIGARAQPLMRELLQLMTGGPGGLGGFLDRFRKAGMSNEVSSFMGGRSEAALPPKAVDDVLGEATVTGISQRVGLSPSVVSNAAGFEIPKLIGMLTPGGRVPNTLPSEVQNFVRSGDQVPPVGMTVVGEPEPARADAQVPPMGRVTAREAPRRRNVLPWIIGLLVIAALLGWLLSRRPPAPAQQTTPAAPATAPAARAPATTPPTASAPASTATAPPAAPATPAPETARAVDEVNTLLGGTVLNFRTGSAVLPSAATPTLRQAAERINSLPAGTVIEIAGHTDNTGDANANQALSQRRAEAVRDALVRDGVNPSMLTARGYGDSQPVASNDTAQGRYQNRRINFSVAGQATTTGGAG